VTRSGGAGAPNAIVRSLQGYWAVWIALLALAIPTLITLGQQVWSTEAGAQGPIVLFTGAWLVWRKFPDLKRDAQPGSSWLTALLAAGALGLYIFGRAYDFISIEVAGFYGVAITFAYSYFGFRALRKIWFPLFYLAFVIPPPGWLMDELTVPLKGFVSLASTSLLQMFGVPVMREGVALFVAQYQLLVEDACSGMNSLTGLIAISLFYIYLLRDASWRYSLLLVCLVIPIAVVANIIRIIILILLTYFFGDGVAQSFLHLSAGMFLFALALALVFLLDHLISLLRLRFGRRTA
jgi:exosortase